MAVTHILFQFLLLPYGNALRSLFPNINEQMYDKSSFTVIQSSKKSVMVRYPLTVDKSSLSSYSRFDGVEEDTDDSNGGREDGHDGGSKKNSGDMDNGFSSEEEDLDVLDDVIELEVDTDLENDFSSEDAVDTHQTFASDSIKTEESNSVLKLTNETRLNLPLERNVKSDHNIDNIMQQNISRAHKEYGHASSTFKSHPVESQAVTSSTNVSYLKSKGNSSVGSAAVKSDFAVSKNVSAMMVKPGKKKMRCDMPPKSVTSIDEMNSILLRHRRSSRSMRPRWSSARDKEILAAKSQIESAPAVVNDRDLYAPLFRNVSKFKRSYELMERTLKVYIYKDGKKPIFHLPILKGLYASEGWFMKLMQGNKHFVVKDPRKAHLFYMPFSSRMLEYTLYVRNSHNRTNLRLYMKKYAESIAAKYSYWNRTGGADHFLVACHDWAPYETRHHMEHCIKALCNADVTAGFKIGRDVSLPETYVRSARNPLRDLGGKPPSQRNILAFYAGSMHGYLRPILLNHWKDKDPDMKIFGPLPPGVASKMNYIHHMKSSKYCICPRGYEVNSPRVVEAIFYECVPVIISDNFVPPFFDVLDWGAFSLILAEKDIPDLKKILLSISKERYLQMQLGVRKAQRHFIWHPSPMNKQEAHIPEVEMEMEIVAYERVVKFIVKLLAIQVDLKAQFSRPDIVLLLGTLAVSAEDPYTKMSMDTWRILWPVLLDHIQVLQATTSIDATLKVVHCFPSIILLIRDLKFTEEEWQKLMLPIFGLRLAWRLALVSWRCSFYYFRCAQVQVHSIMSRVHKTLRGSSDDIGWLQHTPGMAPVEDGTVRFLELLENIRNGEHTLPNSLVYLLIPGLFSNHGPLYFVGTKRFFSKMGLACHIAKIHSEASVEHNAWELKQYIEELYWGSGKRVMLLGHSKGGVDAAAALSIYASDLKNKVAGLALVQSPYAGTPIASDILREGQIADKETRRIMELLICKIIKGDIRALEDLTYEKRREFISKHQLPMEIPLISFHSEASITPGVLATMTHIAHAELPWLLPLPKFGSVESDDVAQGGHQVPVVIPVSAAMAVCALHLQLRYGEKSDGLVTWRDAEVPGSVVVRPDRKLDHAWMVYSSRKKDPSEPDSCEMCEALLTMLVELGQIKQESDVNYVDRCAS
ncbi:unnamed protein product [Dovyalis caffra]|uniref:Exostosin GT47 domain-containing protein n=1 Tax=Dovyalis caffra TaxID=77055 RepID=A0AAV1RP32_9ROSI|nr:unnamed protein product [Dovyalis caffra]